jgi:hypothetical protein
MGNSDWTDNIVYIEVIIWNVEMDRNKKLKHPLKDSFGNVAKLTKINDMQRKKFPYF